ncbi:DUF222 domain-containing protein [Leucobacter allii]|uniref:DUF222 domain-containing protein n=1 Tax=Leucobacter allii TaxID=2932247 RepID=A0ABY4FL12_9MICO|nr:HNH endonuclease signature motif containing protein [Leucobacter allii]UOQ56960.1 DUF222 domain-containing protein [Leucobacter allii]
MTNLLHDPPREALDALAAVVSGVRAVRAQLAALQAAELLLLQAGETIAEGIATAGAARDREMAHRMVHSEIGAAVRESDRAIAAKSGRAARLVEAYPAVYAALSAGRVSLAHANVIADAGAMVNDDRARPAYEEAALACAETETAGRLRPVAAELAERFAERTLDERHAEACASRRVVVVPGEDGMADLIAHLPAVQAAGIKDRLDRIAHHLRGTALARAAQSDVGVASDGPAPTHAAAPAPAASSDASTARSDRRSMDELRADVFTDLLLGAALTRVGAAATDGICGRGDAAAEDVSGIAARVQVVIPVSRFRPSAPDDPGSAAPAIGVPGHDGPATLEGFGPIDDAGALALAAEAGAWDRVEVESSTGDVISVDRYRPSAQLRRFLGARDLRCRFPGCRAVLRRCDIDHTVDAALGGPTTSANLGHLCRRHHTMKHATAWTVRQDGAGVFTWTSPLGRQHVDQPGSRVRFMPVDTDAPTGVRTGSQPAGGAACPASADARPDGARPPDASPDGSRPDGARPGDSRPGDSRPDSPTPRGAARERRRSTGPDPGGGPPHDGAAPHDGAPPDDGALPF